MAYYDTMLIWTMRQLYLLGGRMKMNPCLVKTKVCVRPQLCQELGKEHEIIYAAENCI